MALGRERAGGIYENQEFIPRQGHIGLLLIWSRNRGQYGCKPVGLGAMLTQKKRDGHITVTYISRSLSPVEQRYSQTEREALAIRWPCERLRVYLAWAQFQVVTDQMTLEAISQ